MRKDEILEVIRSKEVRLIPSKVGLNVNLISKTEPAKSGPQDEKEIAYYFKYAVLLRIPYYRHESDFDREAAQHLHSFLYRDIISALHKIRVTLEDGDKRDAANQLKKLIQNI